MAPTDRSPTRRRHEHIVNLRDSSVELHLGSVTIVVGPHDAILLPPLDEHQRNQLDELVRRNLVAVRPGSLGGDGDEPVPVTDKPSPTKTAPRKPRPSKGT